MNRAEEFLKQTLARGPVSYQLVKLKASDLGIYKSELREARLSLGVRTRSIQNEFRRTVDWDWYLP